MMFGTVNNNCEAIIKVAVGRIGSPKVTVDAVIDTGFIAIATLLRTFLVMCFACCQKCPCPNLCGGSHTSFLSLPLSMITDLGLPWHYRDVGTLGDGSEVVFEIYKATVIWDGQNQIVDVAASEADPLVGMGLLYGFKLQIEAVEGGLVTIEALK